MNFVMATSTYRDNVTPHVAVRSKQAVDVGAQSIVPAYLTRESGHRKADSWIPWQGFVGIGVSLHSRPRVMVGAKPPRAVLLAALIDGAQPNRLASPDNQPTVPTSDGAMSAVARGFAAVYASVVAGLTGASSVRFRAWRAPLRHVPNPLAAIWTEFYGMDRGTPHRCAPSLRSDYSTPFVKE